MTCCYSNNWPDREREESRKREREKNRKKERDRQIQKRPCTSHHHLSLNTAPCRLDNFFFSSLNTKSGAQRKNPPWNPFLLSYCAALSVYSSGRLFLFLFTSKECTGKAVREEPVGWEKEQYAISLGDFSQMTLFECDCWGMPRWCQNLMLISVVLDSWHFTAAITSQEQTRLTDMCNLGWIFLFTAATSGLHSCRVNHSIRFTLKVKGLRLTAMARGGSGNVNLCGRLRLQREQNLRASAEHLNISANISRFSSYLLPINGAGKISEWFEAWYKKVETTLKILRWSLTEFTSVQNENIFKCKMCFETEFGSSPKITKKKKLAAILKLANKQMHAQEGLDLHLEKWWQDELPACFSSANSPYGVLFPLMMSSQIRSHLMRPAAILSPLWAISHCHLYTQLPWQQGITTPT